MFITILILLFNFFVLVKSDNDFCPIKKWYQLNDDRFTNDKCFLEDKQYEERKSLFLKVCNLSIENYNIISKEILNKIDDNKFIFFYFTNFDIFIPWDLLTCFNRGKKYYLKSNINEKLYKILGNNIFIFTFIKNVNNIISSFAYIGISIIALLESLVSKIVRKIFNKN